MKKNNLPLRGMRPLDGGGIYLLAQISVIMVQALAGIVLGFVSNGKEIDYSGNMIVQYVLSFLTQVVFVVTPLIYCRYTGVNFLRELKPKNGLNISQVALLIPITLCCIVAFMPLSSLFVMLMGKMGYTYNPISVDYLSNAGYLILAILFLCIFTCVGEEVLFRGFLARGLKRFGIIWAMVLSSFLFATAHGNLIQLVYQFFLGLVLFTVFFATKSIYASMIVHCLNNTFGLVFNFILFKTTGSVEFSLELSGAGLVFSMLGISIAGMLVLTLFVWLFLKVAKKRQDKYVGDRVVDLTSSKVYGKHNKLGKNFITKYFDYLRYLNYSFEDEELENDFKIKEELNLMNAKTDAEIKYGKEMLETRIDKDKRWDRNMLFLALAYNFFLLLLHIVRNF